MEVPFTALSTFVGLVIFLAAWFLTGRRITQSSSQITRPVLLLRKFFLHMCIFFLIMTMPAAWLWFDAAGFPLATAWCYTIGHIFLYTAFAYAGAAICNIVPRLASKEKIVWVTFGVVLNAAVTVLTAATMVWGTQPSYNYDQHVFLYNASPAVGAAIGVLALLTMFPLGILFLAQAFKNHGAARTRPLLLGIGFICMTVAGPLHDNAQNWQTYFIADIFTVIGLVLTGVGMVYKIGQVQAPTQAAQG